MASEREQPRAPNVLVTGTPGTGKTTLSAKLCDALQLKHVEVGSFALQRGLVEPERDATFDCPVLDEDRVLDALEPIMVAGGVVLEYHSCDWFPERWIQLAVVLRCSTEALYGRLEARGYRGTKLENNMSCEILNVLADEANESYKEVVELHSDTERQMDENVERVAGMYRVLLDGRG